LDLVEGQGNILLTDAQEATNANDYRNRLTIAVQ